MATTRRANTKSAAKKEPEASKAVEEAAVQEDTKIESGVQQFDRVDPHTIVLVRSGFHGLLVYTSPHTGAVFTWGQFGDTLEMEIGELRHAKNSSAKAFFENNWFMFDEEYRWVIDYLGVRQFYKYSMTIDDIGSLATMTPDEIESALSNVPEGQKEAIIAHVREMVRCKAIDSLKVIAALERTLGIQLIGL
ncbi:MAG: hypothetical protein IKI58_04120 [Oscillospiraceae bacterium]|nr:hypothetical protein [Oscillospiraceae bacterium]